MSRKVGDRRKQRRPAIGDRPKVRRQAVGDGPPFVFDLSRITSDEYASLMKTLAATAINSLPEIGFTLDFQEQVRARKIQTEESGTRGDKLAQSRARVPSSSLRQSVVFHNTRVVHEVFGLLGGVLPRTRSLTSVELRSLPTDIADIRLLADGVFQCEPLRHLHLCNIPLGDQGFAIIGRALRRRSVIDLQCRKCQLTDACARDVQSLLAYHVFVQSEYAWKATLRLPTKETVKDVVCLQTLDLRDNELTFEFVDVIRDVLLDRPLACLDLRGNDGISDAVVAKLREQGVEKLLTGRSNSSQTEKPKRKNLRATIRKLEDENETMRKVIGYLREGEHVVELEPGLTIVGPRAADLAQQIHRLDELLKSYSDGPLGFLDSGSRDEKPSPGPKQEQIPLGLSTGVNH